MEFKFESIRTPDPEFHPKRSITFATVKGSDGMLIAEGYAVKRPDEPYNKILGQKFALMDALESRPKLVRSIVWEEFFMSSKGRNKLIIGD